MAGPLRLGDRLPFEEKLAKEHHMGRKTVQEAFKVFINMGLIERKNKSAVVFHYTKSQVFPEDIIGRMKR